MQKKIARLSLSYLLLLAFLGWSASLGAVSPDRDGDGILNRDDNCPGVINPDQDDSDDDGAGDACDFCPENGKYDTDEDGLCDWDDNCYSVPNAEQQDTDGDGFGDVCERGVPQFNPLKTFAGSYEEIGRQIAHTYPDIIIYTSDIFSILGVTPQLVQGQYDAILDLIPESIRQHLQGMAFGLTEVRPLSYETAWNTVLTTAFAINALNTPSLGTSVFELAPGGCTAFAVSSANGTFLAHNTDNSKGAENYGAIMRIVPDNGDNSYIHLFAPAFVDVGLGLNDKEIAVSYNVGRPNDNPLMGLPPLFMVRHVMEKASTLDEAVSYFTDFIDEGHTYGYGGAILLLVDFKDSSMAKIQIKSDDYKVTYGNTLKEGVTFVATTNHFDDDFSHLSGEDKENSSNISSLERWNRLMEILPGYTSYAVDTCFDILSDHGDGSPTNNTISRDGGQTVTTVTNVFAPDRVYYTLGMPHRYLDLYAEPVLLDLAPVVDTDHDGISNAGDNCPYVNNSSQEDQDGDGIGDPCDSSSPCLVESLYGGDSELTGLLRDFRDTVLRKTPEGRALIDFYYQVSPYLVTLINTTGDAKILLQDTIDRLFPVMSVFNYR